MRPGSPNDADEVAFRPCVLSVSSLLNWLLRR
jgi:hypothetical protein